MTSRDLLLTLHIASIAGWLGANYVQMVLSPRIAKGPTEVAVAWTRLTIWLGARYYGTVGALIALTGVGLVLDTDISWASGFIWVGAVVIVIGGVMGGTVFAPLAERRAAALESGDATGAGQAMARIMGFAVLDTGLVLLAVLAMVHHWHLRT